MRLAYLYSRYAVLSQTFCDLEMLELERRGEDLLIGSVHPPLTSLRHEHIARFRAPAHYAPPAPVLRLWEKKIQDADRWPGALIERHERQHGPDFKAALRARNASVNEIGPWLSRKAKIEWAGARPFWEEWSHQLKNWTQRA